MARRVKLEFNKRRLSGFSGNQLKMIACFLMLCDDIGFMLIENGMLYGQNPDYWILAINSPQGARLYLLARILRLIGRLAFPLFAYLLVEGFLHTKSRKQYGQRLLLLALVSEVPFDLACRHVVWDPAYQNVCFTLFLGLCALSMIERVKRPRFLAPLLMIAAFAGLSWCLRADYGGIGVVLIALLYLLRKDHTIQLWAGAGLSAIESLRMYGVSALSFLLIRFYNGKRGTAPLKYIFYIIYPLHLLLFWFFVYLGNR